MGGGTEKSSNQVTKIELPPWVDKASQSNYKLAEDIAAKPYQPYGGERVADLSGTTNAAIEYLMGNVGSQQGGYDNASSALTGLLNFNAGGPVGSTAGTSGQTGYDRVGTRDVSVGNVGTQTVGADQVLAGLITPQTVAGSDLTPYLNPRVQEVENYALDAVNRQGLQTQNALKSNAVSSKAFGGSRQGIMEGITSAETARQAGDLSANLRKDSYDNAMALLTGDISRDLTAQTSNVGNRLAADVGNADRTLSADTLNVNNRLDADKFNVGNRLAADTGNADRSLKGDLSNQSTRLAADTSNQATSLAERLADQRAQIADREARLAAAGIQSNAATSLASVADTQRAGLMADVGALLNAGSVQQGNAQAKLDQQYGDFTEARDYDTERLNLLLASLGMSPYGRTETTNKTEKSSGGSDWATAALGGANLLKGLIGASDDDLKTDKEKIGIIPGTEKLEGGPLEAWAYRYKKDPKSYAKVVGVMASDVEKKIPHAVKRVGKTRVIDYDAIFASIAS